MRKIVFFSTLCLSGSLIGAGASWYKPETILFGVAAGVHLTVLLFLAFMAIDDWRNGPAIGPLTKDGPQPRQVEPPKPAKPAKRSRFVPPTDGVVEVRVAGGADIAGAVARYASEWGLDAYQSATAGFLLRDTKRKKIYRTRIQVVPA